MRIWSLHPKHLDAKGLVALWRETLLAKHVLEGKTKGYKNHPQLIRFKETENPLDAINAYLQEVLADAHKRNYRFNATKIGKFSQPKPIPVTSGQLVYEREHLLKKLAIRDGVRYAAQNSVGYYFEIHPLFQEVDGEVEDWEVVM